MPLPRLLPMTRRTTLGVALLAAAGCSTRSDDPAGSTPAATTDAPTDGTALPSASSTLSDTDADLELLAEARAQLAVMTDLLERTGAAHPQLEAPLTPFVALHAAHDAVIAESVPEAPTTGPSSDVPRSRTTARRRVLGRERALQEELAGLALRARSGPLARLLASMSAAVGQQLVSFDASGGGS